MGPRGDHTCYKLSKLQNLESEVKQEQKHETSNAQEECVQADHQGRKGG